jgi:hypothetical protein
MRATLHFETNRDISINENFEKRLVINHEKVKHNRACS